MISCATVSATEPGTAAGCRAFNQWRIPGAAGDRSEVASGTAVGQLDSAHGKAPRLRIYGDQPEKGRLEQRSSLTGVAGEEDANRIALCIRADS